MAVAGINLPPRSTSAWAGYGTNVRYCANWTTSTARRNALTAARKTVTTAATPARTMVRVAQAAIRAPIRTSIWTAIRTGCRVASPERPEDARMAAEDRLERVQALRPHVFCFPQRIRLELFSHIRRIVQRGRQRRRAYPRRTPGSGQPPLGSSDHVRLDPSRDFSEGVYKHSSVESDCGTRLRLLVSMRPLAVLRVGVANGKTSLWSEWRGRILWLVLVALSFLPRRSISFLCA